MGQLHVHTENDNGGRFLPPAPSSGISHGKRPSMRDSFVFYRSMKNTIDKAPAEMQLELYRALFDYALDDVEPDDFMAQMIVEAFKVALEKAKKRYETQIENGLKGGRPKKSKNPKNPSVISVIGEKSLFAEWCY